MTRVLVLADVGGPTHHVGDEATCEANVRRLARTAPTATVRVLGRRATAGDIADAVDESDAVLISGGGNLCSTWPDLLAQRIAVIGAAARHGIPVVTGGQTIGPDLSPEEREALRTVLATVACLGVRDVPSARLATQLGVPRERLFYQVDDAFELHGSPPRDPALRRIADRPFLAVTLDASFTGAALERIGRQLAVLGLPVVVLPHVDGADGDVAVGQALLELLPGAVPVPVLTPAEVVWLTQRAAAVVSSRFHPLVFALAGGVPCFGIHRDPYTRIKLQGALAHAGQQHWCMAADDAAAGALGPALRELWHHRAAMRDAIEAARPAIAGREARRWHHLLVRAGLEPADAPGPGPAPLGWPEEAVTLAAALAARAALPARHHRIARTTKGSTMIADHRWDRFARDGFLHLGQVLDADEVAGLCRRADDLALGKVHNEHVLMQLDTGGAYEALPGAVPAFERGTLRYRKLQGLEADDRFRPLVVHPLFLEVCGHMYGPHAPISIFRAMVMNKPAGQGTTLPWHQDGGDVWKLDRDPLVTIWVALDDATVANGCMEAVLGSHRKGLLSDEGSTLSEELAAQHCDSDRIVALEVEAGHAVLLHNWLIHRSGVNPSPASRRAFTGCYMDGRTLSTLTGAHFPLVSGTVGEHPFVAQLRTDTEAAIASFRTAEAYAKSLEAALAAASGPATAVAEAAQQRAAIAEEYAASLRAALDAAEERAASSETYAKSLEDERARAAR